MGSKIKRFITYICLVLIALGSAATLGILSDASFEFVQSKSDGQINTVTASAVESKLVAKHTVEYIEKPVTEVKYTERTASKPMAFRNFYTLDELNRWLEKKAGSTTIYLQSADSVIDCDDYAVNLQTKALSDGFIISFEIIGESEYNALFVNQLPAGSTLHAIDLAIIGNNIYYIEPQTGEIVLAAYLD